MSTSKRQFAVKVFEVFSRRDVTEGELCCRVTPDAPTEAFWWFLKARKPSSKLRWPLASPASFYRTKATDRRDGMDVGLKTNVLKKEICWQNLHFLIFFVSLFLRSSTSNIPSFMAFRMVYIVTGISMWASVSSQCFSMSIRGSIDELQAMGKLLEFSICLLTSIQRVKRTHTNPRLRKLWVEHFPFRCYHT